MSPSTNSLLVSPSPSATPPQPAPPRPTLPLPTVQELLLCPLRSSHIYSAIPAPCLHSLTLLLIKLVRAAAATTDPQETHRAFLRLHILPTAVLRRSFRGEQGWRTRKGQHLALRDRIRRATSGLYWPQLWHEALAARQAELDWDVRHSRQRQRSDPARRRISRAMGMAADAQYGRAMRALTDKPLPDLQEETTRTSLTALHPTPAVPTQALSRTDLPPTPDITEGQVLRAARSLNPTSAAGPDRLSPRLLQLLARTTVTPEAGVTGLSALTRLVRRLARGDIPDSTAPLLAASTLIPLQPRPGKLRPIAVGQALRRLVTKVLLPAAIDDTRDRLAPEQLANGVPSGMDAIVHDCRMLLARHGRNPNYVLVSVDAQNAFNSFSRQSMLNRLTLETPSLAHFLNLIYGRTVPDLVLPSSPRVILKSCEGTQQGDPAGMLLFSLALQPLVRRITRECSLLLNRWYADDGTLIGTIPEVTKALRILHTFGPSMGFRMNISKCRAFWPTTEPSLLESLTTSFPLHVSQEGGIALLGAPLGTDEFMRSFLEEKIEAVSNSLTLLDSIPDARIRFHLHRVSGSVCRVEHVFRLTPPRISLPSAIRFDQSQKSAYSRFNHVTLSPSISSQIGLPFRLGGHGFTPLAPFVHASHAASLIESAKARIRGPSNPTVPFYRGMARKHLVHVLRSLNPEVETRGILATHSNLGPFEPQALLERPERVHFTLYQALHGAFSRMYWETREWDRQPNPTDHTAASVRRRARYNSLITPGAASFLCAHPSLTSRVSSAVWSVMLRRHLDTPVYDDSRAPLQCSHCGRAMDKRGDHAANCKHGYGATHRHNIVRNTLARQAFRAAGLACDREVPFLIPGTAHRPADLLVQPSPPAAGALPDRPTAYDVTICNPYTAANMNSAARSIAGAAEGAHTRKLRTHDRILRAALHLQADDPLPPLDWHFVPLAFDTLGAWSTRTTAVLEHVAHQIALRSGCSFGIAKTRLAQRLSFAIWSSVAAATIARMPCHGSAPSYPPQV